MAGPLSTQGRVAWHMAAELYGQFLKEMKSLDFKGCSGNLPREFWEAMDSKQINKPKLKYHFFLMVGLKMQFFLN